MQRDRTPQSRHYSSPQVVTHGSSEEGYVLLAVLFMVVLVTLSLAIAAPKVAAAIQRDRELELVHRGEQYKRAIRLYYKKFGNYPSSIDQLENTNNMRFLRKRYLDPLTGKDDWKLIHVGEAHVCPLGFFGQPLGTGGAIAGATSAASLAAQSTTLGAGSTSNSSFGASSSSFGSSTSSFGNGTGNSATPGATGGGTGCGVQSATGGLNGPGAGDGTSNSGTDSSASSGPNNSGSSNLGSGTASVGGFGAGTSTSTTLGGGNTSTTGLGAATSTTLGGAPIMGVEPPLSKATILQYKLKTKYNEWEFAYWPAEEQMAGGAAVPGGNNINGPGSSGDSSQGAGVNSGATPFSGLSAGTSNGSSSIGAGTGTGSGQTTPP